MGYTNHSMEIITPFLSGIKSICELGSQQQHDLPGLPFMSAVYKELLPEAEYTCIDLNGENDAKKWNLDEPIKTTKKFDLVTDIGTSEHLHDFFTGMTNINKLTKVGGLMFHENPKAGNWPLHGYNYRTIDFYTDLATKCEYEILHLDEWPACWNTTDGWIIRAIMRKTKNGFITKEQFPNVFPE